jgi:hypothetical protein
MTQNQPNPSVHKFGAAPWANPGAADDNSGPLVRLELVLARFFLYSGQNTILRFGVEVPSVVALAQLARWVAVSTVDHTPSLDGWPCEKHVNPPLDVLVILYARELAGSIKPAFCQPAIPGEDSHIGYRIGAARDVLAR